MAGSLYSKRHGEGELTATGARNSEDPCRAGVEADSSGPSSATFLTSLSTQHSRFGCTAVSTLEVKLVRADHGRHLNARLLDTGTAAGSFARQHGLEPTSNTAFQPPIDQNTAHLHDAVSPILFNVR